MGRAIGFTLQKARKDYECDACDQVLQGMQLSDLFIQFPLTLEERDAVKLAIRNYGLIKKGEVYERWLWVDGHVITMRAIPAMAAICTKYELWDEN